MTNGAESGQNDKQAWRFVTAADGRHPLYTLFVSVNGTFSFWFSALGPHTHSVCNNSSNIHCGPRRGKAQVVKAKGEPAGRTHNCSLRSFSPEGRGGGSLTGSLGGALGLRRADCYPLRNSVSSL